MSKIYIFEYFKVCSDHNSNYSISNFGSIIRNKGNQGTYSGRKIKAHKHNYGYLMVDFYQDGERCSYLIHRLVTHYFIGPCPKDKEVNHIDGDKKNNYVDNLEYITSKENINHAIKSGLRNNYGENHSRAKLTKKIVKKIRKDYRNGFSEKEISFKYKLNKSHINKIINYKLWKSVS